MYVINIYIFCKLELIICERRLLLFLGFFLYVIIGMVNCLVGIICNFVSICLYVYVGMFIYMEINC